MVPSARALSVAFFLAAHAPAQAGLLWERVALPPAVVDFNAYRLAEGDGRLYVGGSRVSGGFFIHDVELVSTDGRSFELLPKSPVAGWSLAWAAVDRGRLHKLVRVSDDRAPRAYVVSTWDPATSAWSASPPLTAGPGEEDYASSLAVRDGLLHVGTTAGALLALSGNAWRPVPIEFPLPAGPRLPPRFVREAGSPLVLTTGGLGRLERGRVVLADERLRGADVRAALAVPGGLLVQRKEGDRMLVERLGAAGRELLSSTEAGDVLGHLFEFGGLHAAGPWDEPRLLSAGRNLSPRAVEANPTAGFRFTSSQGHAVPFGGALYALSSRTLFRARERVRLTLPAFVDHPGRYATALLVANLSERPSVARLRYLPERGLDPRLPSAEAALGPLSELRVEDAAAWLRARGAAPAGPLTGALAVEVVAADGGPPPADAEVAAFTRVVSAAGSGTIVPAVPSGGGLDAGFATPSGAVAFLFGEGGALRSNLVALNAADGEEAPTAWCRGICGRPSRVYLSRADGAPLGWLEVGLEAGGRLQWNRVGAAAEPDELLVARGTPPGGATWDAQPGDDVLVASVLVEESGDGGAWIPAQAPTRDALRTSLFLGRADERTELLLGQDPEAPPAAERLLVSFSRVRDGSAATVEAEVALARGTALRIGDLRAFLRAHDAGGDAVPPEGGFAGTLSVRSAVPGTYLLLAATALRRFPGGGLSPVELLASSRLARGRAAVNGLGAGSSLGVAHAGPPSAPPLGVKVALRSAADGAPLGETLDFRLVPGETLELPLPLDGPAWAEVSGDGAPFSAWGTSRRADGGRELLPMAPLP
jgi:hypothetical protein